MSETQQTGPLAIIDSLFDSSIAQASETHGAEITTLCPENMLEAISTGGVTQKLQMCWRAWSIGTFNFNIGNYFYEQMCQEVEFTLQQDTSSDVELLFDISTFVLGETTRFELSLDAIDLNNVDYTIEWTIGNTITQTFNSISYFDHRWTSSGIVLVGYTISISSLNLEEVGLESFYIREENQASYFELVMESFYEAGDEVRFVPVSSIDQSQNSVEAISSFDYGINLVISFSNEIIQTKTVPYFSPDDHFITGLDQSGQYSIASELIIISEQDEQSFSKTANTITVVELWAELSDTLPTDPVVPNTRVEIEVLHNFYSFDASSLQICWDFGDGQTDSGDATLDRTSVTYPRGGFYNITCTVKSKNKELTLTAGPVSVLFPITNPTINVQELIVGSDDVGSNARGRFFIGVDAGNPLSGMIRIILL